jgi:hypothetical protein
MLPETLVALFICVIMLTVIVPAVFRARRVAQRIHCLNHLKQLSLGFQLYHDAHHTFPPGYVSRTESPAVSAADEDGPGWAWGALLLPHIEQAGVAAMLSFSQDSVGSAARIKIFECASDDPRIFAAVSPKMGTVSLAPSSYVGVFGYGNLTDRPGQPDGPGILYRNSWVRLDDVRDGLSQTLLIGERRQHHMAGGVPVPSEATWGAAVTGAFRPGGYSDVHWDEGPASLVLGTAGQDAPESFCGPGKTSIISAFSSAHEDGIHFARADSSAELISREIDPVLFRRLAERCDQEPTEF